MTNGEDDTHRVTDGPYGFAWGPMEVRRAMEVRGGVVLTVKTDVGLGVDIYVSAGGNSLRVFNKGRELPLPEATA